MTISLELVFMLLLLCLLGEFEDSAGTILVLIEYDVVLGNLS